jgi:hypothetical protein
MSITASEAAKELGIEPKRLRALLRASSEFKAPGSGASWSFSKDDLPTLRKIVEGAPIRGSKTAKNTPITDEAGLPIKICRSKHPHDLAVVRQLSEARVDRLEAALLAAGLHISQLRDRERVGQHAIAV